MDKLLFHGREPRWCAQPEVQYPLVPVGCASAQLFPAELFPIALRDPENDAVSVLLLADYVSWGKY